VPQSTFEPAELLPAPGTLPVPAGLQIWWARVDVGNLGQTARTALAADIDPQRLAKLNRFHRVQDRDRGLAAHSLLRRVLAGITGGNPADVVLRTRCASCGKTEHGKPYLDVGQGSSPVEINLTHSGQVVCLALSPAGLPVGVDVEQRRPMDWAGLRERVFADVEWTFAEATADPDRHRMNAWARKEASVKASGHGLSMPMNEVVVTDTGSTGSNWTATLSGEAGTTTGWDLDLQDDMAAAVAALNHATIGPPAVHRVTIG
jgi:4'-phosphopantetheinyl transferase